MNTFFKILLLGLLAYQLYNFYLIFKAPTISPSEAAKIKKQDAFFVDVRTPGEFTSNHIKGAINIPLNQLTKCYPEIPQNKKIIVVCQSGSRSARGTMKLKKLGFKDVHSLKGGMLAWK